MVKFYWREKRIVGSQQSGKFVSGQFTVAQDFDEQAWPDRFARMPRHDSRTAIGMLEKMVAAFDPQHLEARLFQG